MKTTRGGLDLGKSTTGGGLAIAERRFGPPPILSADDESSSEHSGAVRARAAATIPAASTPRRHTAFAFYPACASRVAAGDDGTSPYDWMDGRMATARDAFARASLDLDPASVSVANTLSVVACHPRVSVRHRRRREGRRGTAGTRDDGRPPGSAHAAWDMGPWDASYSPGRPVLRARTTEAGRRPMWSAVTGTTRTRRSRGAGAEMSRDGGAGEMPRRRGSRRTRSNRVRTARSGSVCASPQARASRARAVGRRRGDGGGGGGGVRRRELRRASSSRRRRRGFAAAHSRGGARDRARDGPGGRGADDAELERRLPRRARPRGPGTRRAKGGETRGRRRRRRRGRRGSEGRDGRRLSHTPTTTPTTHSSGVSDSSDIRRHLRRPTRPVPPSLPFNLPFAPSSSSTSLLPRFCWRTAVTTARSASRCPSAGDDRVRRRPRAVPAGPARRAFPASAFAALRSRVSPRVALR